MIGDKLAWHDYIDYLIKRLNVRMYCFRKLNYFHVVKRILALFYESVVASVWRRCLLCWGGNVSQGVRDKITRIVNQAGRMIGEPRQNLEDVYADLLITKLTNVMTQVIHYTIVSRVNWLLDLAACVCRLPWLAFLLCSTGNQNSQCKLSERHNFHWYVICFVFLFISCLYFCQLSLCA